MATSHVMTLHRISVVSWLLAVGLVVIGLTLHPKSAQRHWVLAAFLIFGGCFILFGSLHALRANHVRGRFWTASRERSPASFWFVVVSGFVASFALFVGAVIL
jgi:hypothetical protein